MNGSVHPEFSSVRVLVADDDLTVAGIMANVVRTRIGCDTVVVYDGDAALASLEQRVADIALVDMVMPGTNGLDLVSQMVKRWPETDIIVVTGHVETFPYVSVINAGAKDFIAKPFPSAELEAKLIRVLRERRSREAQLQAESTYRSIFELNTNGMIFLASSTNQIEDANGVFCELTGRVHEGLIGKPIGELFAARDQERLHDGLALCQKTGKGTLGDLVLERPDGRAVIVDISVTMLAGSRPGTACLAFKDTTEQHEIENSLAEAAQIDVLTGLFNRRMFNTALEHAVDRAARSEGRLALMMMDLDNFKTCNDTHGHSVGDTVLQAVSEVIRGSIRNGKGAGYRCGGDEFAVILSDTDVPTACLVGERVRAAFEKVSNYGTSLSIGVAAFQPGMGSQALIEAADEVLYRAKAQGKNALCVA